MRGNFKILLMAGFLLAGLLTFYKSWDIALMDPDEARYAEASREMIEQKSYIVPLFNDAPRLNKPILFYWLQIGSFQMFGVNEFAARFPSMLAGMGALLIAFLIGRTLYGDRVGIMAVFICFTNLFYLAFSRLGTLDIVLLFFFALSLYFFLKAERSSLLGGRLQKGKRSFGRKDLFVLFFFISLGLSFLTKGPVGVIVPLLIILLYLILRKFLLRDTSALRGEASSPFSWKNVLGGLIFFLLVIVPWGGALIAKAGIFNVLALIQKETAERYFMGFDHFQPFYFYIPLFLVGFLPWSPFLFVAAYRTIRSSFAKYPVGREDVGKDIVKEERETADKIIKNKTRTEDKKEAPENILHDKRNGDLFLLVWLILPVIFFSFSGSKLSGYILPVLPPASLIVASEWIRLRGKRNRLFSSGFAILAAFFAAYLFAGFSLLAGFADFRSFFFSTAYLTMLFMLLILLVFLFSKDKAADYLFTLTAGFSFLFLFSITGFAMPQVQKMRSARELAMSATRADREGRVISYRYEIPSLVFYMRKRVELARNEEELERLAREVPKSFIVISEMNFEGLSEDAKKKWKAERKIGRFILLTPETMVPP